MLGSILFLLVSLPSYSEADASPIDFLKRTSSQVLEFNAILPIMTACIFVFGLSPLVVTLSRQGVASQLDRGWRLTRRKSETDDSAPPVVKYILDTAVAVVMILVVMAYGHVPVYLVDVISRPETGPSLLLAVLPAIGIVSLVAAGFATWVDMEGMRDRVRQQYEDVDNLVRVAQARAGKRCRDSSDDSARILPVVLAFLVPMGVVGGVLSALYWVWSRGDLKTVTDVLVTSTFLVGVDVGLIVVGLSLRSSRAINKSVQPVYVALFVVLAAAVCVLDIVAVIGAGSDELKYGWIAVLVLIAFFGVAAASVRVFGVTRQLEAFETRRLYVRWRYLKKQYSEL